MDTRPETIARSWQNPTVRARRIKGLRRAMRSKAVRQKISDGTRAAHDRRKAAATEAANGVAAARAALLAKLTPDERRLLGYE